LEFGARATILVECFDRQLEKIERWWPAIAAAFGPRQLHVLGTGGRRLPAEIIWARMNRDDQVSENLLPAAGSHSPYLPKSTPA
jgi:hypothetical protein